MRGKLAQKQVAKMKLGLDAKARAGELSPEEGREARAATRIQTVMRGTLAKKRVAEMKLGGAAMAEEGQLFSEEDREARAATSIQAVVRGRRCRAAQVGPEGSCTM